MIEIFKIDTSSIRPIFKQIKDSILHGISEGKIGMGDKLPSINAVCRCFKLSPGTVTKAYEELRQQGIVSSKQGKGYYISGLDTGLKKKIFLLFDRLNAYKEILYYSIIENLRGNNMVDVYFHHYDIKRFEKIISDNLGNYTHYLIMPHVSEDVIPVLEKIPQHQLYLLDRNIEGLSGNYGAVYQDFQNDVWHCLSNQINHLKKYKEVVLIKSRSKFQFIPDEIIQGFLDFGNRANVNVSVLNGYNTGKLAKGRCYIVFPDNELIAILKEIQNKNWKVGKDVGVISYDDTPMKELIFGGISVITTHFQEMGKTMAFMINNGIHDKIANPCMFIERGSV